VKSTRGHLDACVCAVKRAVFEIHTERHALPLPSRVWVLRHVVSQWHLAIDGPSEDLLHQRLLSAVSVNLLQQGHERYPTLMCILHLVVHQRVTCDGQQRFERVIRLIRQIIFRVQNGTHGLRQHAKGACTIMLHTSVAASEVGKEGGMGLVRTWIAVATRKRDMGNRRHVGEALQHRIEPAPDSGVAQASVPALCTLLGYGLQPPHPPSGLAYRHRLNPNHRIGDSKASQTP